LLNETTGKIKTVYLYNGNTVTLTETIHVDLEVSKHVEIAAMDTEIVVIILVVEH